MKILMFAALIFLIIEDLRERAVSVWLLVVFLSIHFFLTIKEEYYSFSHAFENLIILLITGASLYMYTIFRRSNFSEMLGSGDIVFFICITPAFSSPQKFLLFLIISALITLLLEFLFFQQKRKEIPLISYFGVFYIIFTIIKWTK